MTLISAFQISKAFASKNLFKKISFAIEDGQRIGLIGPNGAGKSTLLQILAQKIKPDDGQISFSNSLRLAFLEQKPQFKPDEIIYDCLMSVTHDPYDGEAIALCYELITKLELDILPDKEFGLISQLSGGWQKRVAIARELMKKPNLFLMDEPTNHLDLQSILWLEEFIQKQNQVAFLIITHDRAFLQSTSSFIFDLDPRNPDGLIKSEGSYVQFLETKSMLLDGQKRLEEKRRNTMLIEKDWLARGPQARLTKQKARINRAHDIIDEVDQLENKNQIRKVDFDFGQNQKSPKRLIELKNVSKTFDQRTLFSKLSGVISPGARIGLLGRNGCGKSTLIKMMMGQENPTTGEVFVNPDIQIKYFEQGKEALNVQQSVLKVICPEGDYVHLHGKPVYARSYLSRFYFNNQQMDMPVSQLSGGEQSRLLIAKLMLEPAHVLILDEPTNDLDVETLDVLTECLTDYEGALILVSHDRFFLDQNSNTLWAFTENETGEIIKFSDYNQWEAWYLEQKKSKNKPNSSSNNNSNSSSSSSVSGVSTSDPKTALKKLSYKEVRELEMMESTISEKEKQLAVFQSEIIDPVNASNFSKLTELSEKIASLEKEIKNLYSRWQELEGRPQ